MLRTPLLLPLRASLLFLFLNIRTHSRNAVVAITYHVTHTGRRTPTTLFSKTVKMYSLSGALRWAKAGDTVLLADGTYTIRVDSQAHGTEVNPITIMGGKNAIIKGDSPAVRIRHSWITLQGFTVDGKSGPSYQMDSYSNKCVEVESMGKNENQSLHGFVMNDMVVKNCGTECVRLQNFVVGAEVRNNTIKNCGVFDFGFNQGDQNGEGVYIGTSSLQKWNNGEDRSSRNLIIGNTIATNGSECVDIKEGSFGNIIEYNTCSLELEEKSGCISIRGDDNIVRYNTVKDCYGVGVRLGGSIVGNKQYGLHNDMYNNTIFRADMGAMKIMAVPQGAICENVCRSGPCVTTGTYGKTYRKAWYREC